MSTKIPGEYSIEKYILAALDNHTLKVEDMHEDCSSSTKAPNIVTGNELCY